MEEAGRRKENGSGLRRTTDQYIEKQNSPWHMGKCKGCFAAQKKKEA